MRGCEMFVLYSSSAGRFSFNDADNQNSNSNVSSHLSKKNSISNLKLTDKVKELKDKYSNYCKIICSIKGE